MKRKLISWVCVLVLAFSLCVQTGCASDESGANTEQPTCDQPDKDELQ